MRRPREAVYVVRLDGVAVCGFRSEEAAYDFIEKHPEAFPGDDWSVYVTKEEL